MTTDSFDPHDPWREALMADLAEAAYYEEDSNYANEIAKKYGYRLAANDGKDTLQFYHPETKELIISFRGTELNKKNVLGDIGNDALLFAGLTNLSKRFDKHEEIVKNALDSGQFSKVSVTGHSLGGMAALSINKKFDNIEAHAFNPGQGPIDFGISTSERLLGRKHKNANVYLVKGDPISMAGFAQNANVIYRKRRGGYGRHTIKNFSDDGY